MNRRNMIIGVSAAAPLLLAATPGYVLAQTAAASDAASLSSAPLTATQYRMVTLMGGTLAKQTSQIAMQRAQNPRVSEFAGFEIAEQTTLAQVITDTVEPPPAPLDDAHAEILTQLQSMQPSPAFDRAYIMGQILGHQELLAIQNGYLQSFRSMASDDAHVAMLARTSIQMHLVLLANLQSMLA